MPESTSTFAYRAFISYSHRDKAWADWLHRSLETYRVPSRLVGTHTAHGTIPRRLAPIFRDRDELASATDLGRKVNEALGQSESMVVICSPASAASRWVNEEILAFKRMGRGERIFCLIVAGEPNATGLPGRAAEECFCPALRFKLDADGNPTDAHTEPIAADAREGKDGKANAKLKLIAGMLGVGLDTLKQREQQRRMRRMALVTALALVVMAVTSVLAVYAWISRQQAVAAQQAAERRQKQAEGLVDFMLGDLSTKLRQVDRLDILGAVDDKAMAYFKTLPATDVNATALAQRAKALQKIGEVRMDRSRLSEAMDAFQQALGLNQRLVNAAPNDPARQNAYAENLLWIGFADWNAGKTDHAEQAFRQSAAALERAVSLAPADNDVAHNLDDVYDNLGHVAQARNELDLASREFNRDLALCQRMLASHPDDLDWRAALGAAYDNIATIALMRGHLDAAIRGYIQEHRVLAGVVARHPKNVQVQDNLIRSDAILGRTLALAGRMHEGVAYVESALQLGARRLKFDPSHDGWRGNQAYYGALLGRLRLEQGDVAGASASIENAVTALQALVRKDPGNVEWREDLATAQLDAARLALARGQPGEVKRSGLAALASLQKPLRDQPSSDLIRTDAATRLLLAQVTDAPESAAASRKHAREEVQAIAAKAPDPRTLAVLVGALLASGQREDAEPHIRELQRTGYRPPAFVALLQRDGIQYPENGELAAHLTRLLQTQPAPAAAGPHP